MTPIEAVSGDPWAMAWAFAFWQRLPLSDAVAEVEAVCGRLSAVAAAEAAEGWRQGQCDRSDWDQQRDGAAMAAAWGGD